MKYFTFPKKDFKGYPEYAQADRMEKKIINSIQEDINNIHIIVGIDGLTSAEKSRLAVCANKLIEARDIMLRITTDGESIGETIKKIADMPLKGEK
jgi:hypothetical protein